MKTRNFLLTALLTTTAFTFSNAQTAQNEADNTTSRDISFGVKGGVNFSTVTGGDKTPDSRTSFHVGAVVEFPLADVFSLQAEGLYSGQGFDLDSEGPDGDNAEVQLDYINMPVLAKIYVTKGLSVDVGPQFSFLVNEEIDLNPNSNDGDVDLENTPFEANTFDFGIVGGLTFQTEMGLFASGRYTYGLTDIYDENSLFSGFNGLHNQVWQISVGYKF